MKSSQPGSRPANQADDLLGVLEAGIGFAVMHAVISSGAADEFREIGTAMSIYRRVDRQPYAFPGASEGSCARRTLNSAASVDHSASQ